MGEISNSAQEQVAIMQKQLNSKYEPHIVCTKLSDSSMNLQEMCLWVIIEIQNFGNIAKNLKVELMTGDNLESKFEVFFEGDRAGEEFISLKEEGVIRMVIFELTDKSALCRFKILYKDLIGRSFELCGQYDSEAPMTSEDIFPNLPIDVSLRFKG